MTSTVETTEPTATIGLRGTAFASIVLLLVEFGIGVNLFGKIPKVDNGKSTFGGFAAALTNGPAALAIHATVGTLLIVAAIAAVVRAVYLRHTPSIVLSAVALVSVIGAWFSGSSYVGDHASGAARGMEYATALAILCYALILLVVPNRIGATPTGELVGASND